VPSEGEQPVDLDTRERPSDDLRAVDRLSAAGLARLLHATIGLSDESIDLLTSMAGRLRAAEGVLPDPTGH